MTQQDEIQILMAAAYDLGPDSYLGPWLDKAIPFIESSIRNDLIPMTIEEGSQRAYKLVTDAKEEAETLKLKIIADANSQATDMILSARTKADTIGDYARKELDKALNDASYAAGCLVKAINEL